MRLKKRPNSFKRLWCKLTTQKHEKIHLHPDNTKPLRLTP